MNTRLRVAVIVLIGTLSSGAVASGCAMGGYDEGALHERLVDAGLGSEAATCVLDGMNAKFGSAGLDARAEPSGLELAAQRAILRKCGVTPNSAPR